MRRLFLSVALATLILALASRASAHAYLARCDPGVAGTVSAAPKELRCTFSQELAAPHIVAVVTNEQRERVDLNDARIDPQDKTSFIISLDSSKMTRGYYRVQYAVVSAQDFDLTTDAFYFGLQVIVPPTPTPDLSTPPITTGSGTGTSPFIPGLIGAAATLLVGSLVLFIRAWRDT